MNSRAQIFSVDLVVAIIIAAAAWGILFTQLSFSQDRLGERMSESTVLLRATHFTNALVRTPGTPRNWQNATSNVSNILALGLADKPFVLSPEKVDAFFSLEVDDLKELLNVPPELIRISLERESGAEIFSMGDSENFEGFEILALRRPVLYNGSAHLFEVRIRK